MTTRKDWLSKSLPELNVMFANVDGKIGNYKIAYGLRDAWITQVKLLCETFTTVYAKIAQNRATEKQMNDWFDQLLSGTPKGSVATPAPTFQPVVLPSGATIGLLDDFREMMRYFKANAAYTEADGADLMIISTLEEGGDVNDAAPTLKISVNLGGAVEAAYTKGSFSGLELQWRKSGTADWLMADKSTEKLISFTPEPITPPEKIELRGVYLLKNQRVGNWSPIYTITVG